MSRSRQPDAPSLRRGTVSAAEQDRIMASRRSDSAAWGGGLQLLGRMPGVAVVSVLCREPARTWTEPAVPCELATHGDHVGGHEIWIPRRGGWLRRIRGREYYVDPTTAMYHCPTEPHQVAHPRAGGDDATLVSLSADALVQLTGDGTLSDGPMRTTPEVDLQHRLLVAHLQHHIDTFELEERVTNLIAGIVEHSFPGRHSAMRPQTELARRRIADHVQEAIAADPTKLALSALASSLAYSRFHISRVFHQMTGSTLVQYRNRIRAATVLNRLADGEPNLARLAAELGFADQSHMCHVVTGVYGAAPKYLRRLLSDSETT
jgi:AraC-like DNA-binding protein